MSNGHNMAISVTPTDRLERYLAKLYENQREMQNHPSFPFISDIPGYQWNDEEIDRIEAELDHRRGT